MVIPDQFIDRTRHRISTFFGEGIVAHIAFGNPVCPQLTQCLTTAIASLEFPEVTLHQQGTYVCMEGPAFSTIAESNLYRSWGGSVIGMTNLPEAKLAREAEIAYATLALVTDYDCWHADHDHVTVEMIIDNLQRNAINAQKVILETVKAIHANPFQSAAHNALQYALLTQPEQFPVATREKLALLLKKYL
jgi:5'-methylthioadenosine phosphorylase